MDVRNAEEDKTAHWKITSLWGKKKVQLRETQRAVTPFGGLVVFFEFLRQVGYRQAVNKYLPFRLTSPNAIDPVETFTAFFLSVVAGARRFAHTSLLSADVALHTLLGIARFPGDDTIRNLFKRFGQGQCQRFFSGLWSWQLERLPECSAGYSLDLDSTVFERYGRQQGALRRPNPRKHGRPSHHALVAVLAEAHFLLHGWLRSGNSLPGVHLVILDEVCPELKIAIYCSNEHRKKLPLASFEPFLRSFCIMARDTVETLHRKVP